MLSVSQWDGTGADKKLFLIHHEHTNPSLGSSLHNITSLPIMQSVSVYESHFHIMWKGTESAQLSDVPWKVTKLNFFLFSLKIWDRKFSFFILLFFNINIWMYWHNNYAYLRFFSAFCSIIIFCLTLHEGALCVQQWSQQLSWHFALLCRLPRQTGPGWGDRLVALFHQYLLRSAQHDSFSITIEYCLMCMVSL